MGKVVDCAGKLGLHLPTNDPIDDVIKLFTGDWKLWADHAQGWKQCATAVREMTGNLTAGVQGLQQVWTGNAADQVVSYFAKFATATKTEASFFDYLYRVYEAYMNIVWDFHKQMDDLVNMLVDELCELGISNVVRLPGKVMEIVKKIEAIVNLISGATGALDRQGHADHGIIASEYTLATATEPDCEVETMLYTGGGHAEANAHGYQHPGDTK